MTQLFEIINEQYNAYWTIVCLCQLLLISKYTLSLIILKFNLAFKIIPIPITQNFNVIKHVEEISFKFKDYNIGNYKNIIPNNVDQIVFSANVNPTNTEPMGIEWWTMAELEALPQDIIEYLKLYFNTLGESLAFLNIEVTSIVELPGLDIITLQSLTMLVIINALNLNQEILMSQIYTMILPYMEIVQNLGYSLPPISVIYEHATSLIYGSEFYSRIDSDLHSRVFGYEFDSEVLSNYIRNSDFILAADTDDEINVLMTGQMMHEEVIKYVVNPLLSSIIDIINHYMVIQA